MLMEENPFNHISYGIENKWCRTETKGEREVNVELTTLAPPGEDKSTIKRHLPGWPFLGMIPILLIRKRGNGGEEKGPATLPRDTSLAKYASTMWA